MHYGYCNQCRRWRQIEPTAKGNSCDRCRRIYKLQIQQPVVEIVKKPRVVTKRGVSDREVELLNFLAHGPATTDEIREAIGQPGETPSAVRSLLWRLQVSGKIISRKFNHRKDFPQCWALPHQEVAIAARPQPLIESEQQILQTLADGRWKTGRQILQESAWEKNRSNFYERLQNLKSLGLVRTKKKAHKSRLWALVRSSEEKTREN